MIVGFPGETEALFLEIYNFPERITCFYLQFFNLFRKSQYRAAEMEDVVPMKIRNKRSKMLRILSEKEKEGFLNEENLGKTFQVLFEEDIEEG